MMDIRSAVERHWRAAEESPPGLGAVLALGSLGFSVAAAGRSALYDQGLLTADQGPIPVISVGNITVGGTGKTPVVRWLVERLLKAGHSPAVVLRGYGGDETLLHRRWYPTVPVLESARRIDGVRLAAQEGATVAVCDDAFQHRSLVRDLDIVLLSAEDQRPRRLLPAGPYREPFQSLTRADLILITEKGARSQATEATLQEVHGLSSSPPTHSVTLGGGGWTDLHGVASPAPSGAVLVATGVGAPLTVQATVAHQLELTPDSVELMAFPDHHPYTKADVDGILQRAADRPIVTTEKDAVKLLSHRVLDGRVHVVGMTVDTVEQEEHLWARIVEVCAR